MGMKLLVKKHPNPYGPSRTKTIPAQEHDINLIMARYQKTGQVPTGKINKPLFADVADVGDYQKVQMLSKQYQAAMKEYMAKTAAKAAKDKADQAAKEKADQAAKEAARQEAITKLIDQAPPGAPSPQAAK